VFFGNARKPVLQFGLTFQRSTRTLCKKSAANKKSRHMVRHSLVLVALLGLTACGSGGSETNVVTIGPLGEPVSGDIDDVGNDDASSNASIERYEEAGQASDITYDAINDKFYVDNLAFDGTGEYDRDDVVATLNGFRVYENNNVTERREYKALYLESPSGLSRVAIVRTGSYQGYGFGGFVYSREGGVTLPTSGQATFAGDYAGMRVYNGQGGLEYTTADADLIVDFDDFNSTRAVEGTLTNRQVFDTDGNPIDTLPTLVLATGSITDAGEIQGTASSERFDAGAGEFVDFESGDYYAVIGGANADEIVGVIVVEAVDPDNAAISIQETGGFIAIEVP